MLPDKPLARQVSSRYAMRTAEAGKRLGLLCEAQGRVRRELEQRKFQVTGATQTLVNAIFVRTSADRVGELRGIAGVERVVYLPPIRRHLDQAAGLVGAPGAWNALGGTGKAGAGVKIAILDTGIDQSHAAFQDTSLSAPSGFPKSPPEFSSYTNNKIIVARSYVSLVSSSDPAYSTPDDNSPRDRSGHGTAVAMIAAGVQNTGPLATITGIAPKAWLGNYKVFGTPGVSGTSYQAIVQALTDALSDGMDIAVLPFGAIPGYGYLAKDCGSGSDVCDPEGAYPIEQAVDNAISKGMTVVTSAGNDGDLGNQFPTLGTVETPGIAPGAITVGAVTNAHQLFQSVNVAGSNLQNLKALFGDGPKTSKTITAPVVDVSALQNDGYACSALPGGSLNGSIALIQRGTCVYSEKINNAQNAGAVAVLLYQSSGVEQPTDLLGAPDTGIPAVMVGYTDGTGIKTYLQGHAGASASLNPAWQVSSDTPSVVVDSSSRGPVIGDLSIKPDLVAPGANIYTATERSDPGGDLYDPSGYRSAGGTSVAVSFAAGAAALVKQKNSGFSPAQIKSALVNTAGTDVTDGSGQARVAAVGGGRLNAAAAVGVGATIEPATLSFGAVSSGSLPINRTLKVTNTSSAAITFGVAVARRDADSKAQLTVSPSSLSVNPGQTGNVTVTLQGSAPSAGSYEGAINLTGGGTSLHVPYLYLAGDGVPFNIFPILGGSFTGAVGDQNWTLAFKLTDRYGVPVAGQGISFNVVSGGGSIGSGDSQTDKLGIAAASVNLGSTAGDQVFSAQAGGQTVQFFGYARPLPAITTNGVVNAASNQAGQGLAPGSYITIYGTALSDATQGLSTTSLPLSLSNVSVSFDAPNLSVPGRLSFVSPGQVNVQIPWELQGAASAQMKVAISGIATSLYTLTLSDYAPAAFEYSESGRQLVAATDQNNALITSAHPAVRGQVVVVYANGLGPVNNRPASGEASPGQPLADAKVIPTVTIGGKTAQVQFAGLTPSSIGLYQLNVVVPTDAASGTQPLVITVNGISSKSSNLPVQ